ncbi:MAG: hypothetical protein VZR27_06455 [Acutalibacteraceae bacterium]|nr:hypothetical protein [Acutalibacteraceae bacterium]
MTITKASNTLTYKSAQSVNETFNTIAQKYSLTAAQNAQGALSYSVNSQKNSSGTAVSYFSVSGTTLTTAANTPVGTYKVVVRAAAGRQ